MARLDVRDRKIEATIAYLGPDFAGRTTNLLRLGAKPVDGASPATDGDPRGELLAIDWRPIGLSRFDDCDVAVRILAPRGPLDDERVRRAVRDADGVVVVLDSAPEAMKRNEEWLDPARELLGRGSDATKTVVVQLNKSDLSPTDALAQLLDDLDLGRWPRVSASAARGDGVVETVRCAMERVVADLERGGADAPAANVRADAHPLLTALRHVLREAIDDRIGAIEERVVARVVSSSEAAARALEARIVERVASSSREQAGTLEDRLAAAVCAKVEATLAPRFAAQWETMRSELAEREERVVAQIGAAVLERFAAVHAELAESAVQTLQLRDAVVALEARLVEAVAASAAEAVQRPDVEAVERRVRDVLAASSRADREHQAAAITALRRAVEGLKVDLRPLDHGAEIKSVADRLSKLSDKLDEAFAVVVPTAAAVRSIPLRVGESQDRTRNVVVKSVEDLGQRVESSIESMQTEGGAVWARIDARSAKVETAIDELLEELKKRKKGWFG